MHEGCIIPATCMDQRLRSDGLDCDTAAVVCVKLHFRLSRTEDVNILVHALPSSLLFWDKHS